jgi:uncharacterized protein (DUF952 family)
MRALFHIVDPAVWAATRDDYRPASLAAEGFIHFSFADQVAGSANRHYADAEILSVLEIDPERLPDPVVIEDSYGSGTEFPHLYGPLPLAAVVAIHPLPRDAAGQFTFDEGDRASPDR